MDTELLIVGAGPTGLMLANQLARRGHRPTIIDRHSGPAQQTRAMAVHARTLEIYRKLGVSEEAIDLGQVGNGANMWAGGERRARVPLDEMGKDLSAFPYVLMLGQDTNEHILGRRLKGFGIDIQWNTELVAIEQQPDHVVATIKNPDGSTRRTTARYVAGCDGARSTVRELSGIKFPGAPYEHVFFVADTECTGQMVPSELNVYLWSDGFHLYFPMRGANRWRVIGILPKVLRGREGLTFDDLVPHLRKEIGAQLSFAKCDWFSTYKIQHRCTERWRDRRCFLAGDAAHVHSPMGGQGMNTGLQDAYNLAWKMALVLEGKADDRILNAYEAERMPVAHALLESTDRAFRLLVSESWLAGVLRTKVMARVAATMMRQRRVRRLVYLGLSQIGIAYPKSPLSRSLAGAPARGPRAGDRFPWLHLKFHPEGLREDVFQKLDDTRFNLLLIGQSSAPAGSEMLRVHQIPSDGDNATELARAGITAPAFYLLRPDGHVAIAGGTFSDAALGQWIADMGLRLGNSSPRDVAVPV